MATTRRKRSVSIARHRTSISLEEPFWRALQDFAKRDGRSVADLIGDIDKNRGEVPVPSEGSAEAQNRARGTAHLNLSAAIRLYVLERTRKGA